MKSSTRRSGWIAILVLAVLPLLFVGPALAPGHALLPLDLHYDLGAWKESPLLRLPVSNRLLSDVVTQFYPWDVQVRRMIRDGEMPWRNAYAGDGAPLWANPQTALFSPFTVPRLLLGARGWAWSVLLKLIVAGIGAWLLLRMMGCSPWASTIVGIVYGCSGYLVLYGLHPHSNVFALLPLLAAASLAFLRAPGALRALYVALCAAAATAGGHPETLFVGVVAVAIFLIVGGRGINAGAASWARVSLSALAGFLLLGVTLVPFAIIAWQSDVAASRPNAPARAFRMVAVPGQILPGFLGTNVADELDFTAALPDAENMNLRSGGFIGAIALLILLLAVRALSSRDRVLLLIAVCFLVISWLPPGISLLLKKLPIVSVVAPEYFALAFAFLALVPLGAALDVLPRLGLTRRLGIVVLVVSLLGAIGAAIIVMPLTRPIALSAARRGIAHLQQRGHFHLPPAVYEQRMESYLSRGRIVFMRRFVIPALTWALAGIALMSASTRRTRLLGLALALEMIVFAWHLLPVIRLDPALHALPPPLQAVVAADPARQWLIAAPWKVYPANIGTGQRVRQIDSYDVLPSVERVKALYAAGFHPMLGFPDIPTEQHIQNLRALGVRFYLTREAIPGLTRIGGGAPPVVGVYEIAGAAPQPLPANAPPEGLRAGMFVTVTGALLAIAVALSVRVRNSV